MSFLLLVVKPKVNYVADHFSPRHIFVFDPAALPAQIAKLLCTSCYTV